ncbi:hypothetical protein HBN50_11580 [Halobacteriovorax sp. GB3]|uniref:hypothetical protein n=1 Tax=Halobacteriovorax sp. GB3 TaxID=2719615 RepID=UPI002360F38B|nr:hypothetical protein [Halobacteriovorax sp. GB3]MDD0853742.1 hypothetical protein [Halobacteriovorax sp. GB3]
MRAKTLGIIGLILSTCLSIKAFAYNDTPNYWRCYNRQGGQWIFGRAPQICDGHEFIDMEFVERDYAELIFSDAIDHQEERRRYMSEMYALIVQTSEYFIRSKKSEVSEEEVEQFIHASLAIAHQESYWSHYRQAQSGHTQFMRGDYGHGHGIMQVDDRWHFEAVTSGKATNIVLNMIYSLEEYYHAWKSAPSKSCVRSQTDWVARARSAYSAYNGGPSKICRWTNSGDRWARNDRGYYDKYRNKDWEKYVDDFNTLAKVDIACLAEGGENCRMEPTAPVAVVEKRFYKMEDASVCVFKDDQLHCIDSTEDRICLAQEVYETTSISEKLYQSTRIDMDQYEKKTYDRHQSCSKVPGLYSIGDTIDLGKNINVRETPGGKLLTTSKKDINYQVLDFIIQEAPEYKRYYKVIHSNKEGYIYAGNKDDSLQWAKKTTKAPNERIIVALESEIKTKKETVLLDELLRPIRNLQKEEILIVKAYRLQGQENSFFFKVQTDSDSGYIYVGSTRPTTNLDEFVENYVEENSTTETGKEEKPEKIEKKYGKLKSSTWYRSMKSCASSRCSHIRYIRGPRLGGKSFEIIYKENSWYLIKSNGKRGFIKEKDVQFL